MDQPDFDPYEVDADGLPLVYNEERIGAFWKGKPGMHNKDLSTQTRLQLMSSQPVVYCRRAHIALGTLCSNLR